jgi:hypothetical protein
MVMEKTPIERLKSDPKNWVRSRGCELRVAPMDTDVRFRVGSFKSSGVVRMAAPMAKKMIIRVNNRAVKNRQSCAQGVFLCGQPVQNLCLAWAQYIGVATSETQAAFLA